MNLTFQAWIVWIVCTIAALVVATLMGNVMDDSIYIKKHPHKSLAISISGTLLLSIVILLLLSWYYTNTAQGHRAFKTQSVNFQNGINRKIEIYDDEGNLLKRYEGKYDIEHKPNDDRIMFDDEHGLRHIIYYKSGMIIVDEIDINEMEGRDGRK